MSSNGNIRTIGLVLEDCFTDFAQNIIRSVSSAINERKDLRLVIVAGRQDDSKDPYDMMHQYKNRYNLIYMMNEPCRFDGLLLTFPNLTRMQRDIYKGIPKVYLATELEDELTVNYDDEMGIREAIDYLVKIRGLSNFCMLGGRSDNSDAQKRKKIFQQCLEDNGLLYTENQYEETDMSTRTEEPATRLLARNPGAEAIFCVNDASASGLYNVLHGKGMVPGRDMIVFAFDNGPLAGDMNPPLASIGADGGTLGQKALELLLDRMNGEEVSSVTVPTRLFGRESLEYEMFEFTVREMLNTDTSFINNFFDNCFYRYRAEIISSGSLNLKRLFYEILSRMLNSLKNRYMSEEEFAEISRMIDVLFDNNIMLYTDPNRFVRSISTLQSSINEMLKSGFVVARSNRLFTQMRDRAIQFHGVRKRMVSANYTAGRNRILEFVTWTTNYTQPGEKALDYLISQMHRIGLANAAMFLYPAPVTVGNEGINSLPGTMKLRCVLRDGELYVIPENRQNCPVSEVYNRSELPAGKQGYVSYPLFCGKYLFGMIVCAVDNRLFEIGEFLTFQLGRALYMNWVTPEEA